MNVTIPQIQTGLGLYIDNELAPQFDGWKKWAFPTVAGLYISNIAELMEHPFVSALGVKTNDGRIDLDKVYAEIVKQAEKSPITITIPKLNDTFSFNKSDVDKLYSYITKGGLTND